MRGAVQATGVETTLNLRAQLTQSESLLSRIEDFLNAIDCALREPEPAAKSSVREVDDDPTGYPVLSRIRHLNDRLSEAHDRLVDIARTVGTGIDG